MLGLFLHYKKLYFCKWATERPFKWHWPWLNTDRVQRTLPPSPGTFPYYKLHCLACMKTDSPLYPPVHPIVFRVSFTLAVPEAGLVWEMQAFISGGGRAADLKARPFFHWQAVLSDYPCKKGCVTGVMRLQVSAPCLMDRHLICGRADAGLHLREGAAVTRALLES